MKDITFRSISVVAVLLLSAGVVSAKEYKMQNTSVTPGAVGTVNADSDKSSGNTQVKIKAEHLAKPSLLTPPANAYVVWIQPQGQAAQNVGVLNVNDDEKADTEMTTTAPQFTVLVTAETEAHPAAPSSRVVLRSEVQE